MTAKTIDTILNDLGRAKPERQRAAFFDELAALPEESRERAEVVLYGRRRFAPGPYSGAEFMLLSPLVPVTPKPLPSAMEARLAAHAVVYAARQAAHAEYATASEALHKARRATGERVPSEREASELDELTAAAARAELDWQDASEAEVRARPHQVRATRTRRFPFVGISTGRR